jgi:hypothetical protein
MSLVTAMMFAGNCRCQGCLEATKDCDILISHDVTYRDARCVSGGDTDVVQ